MSVHDGFSAAEDFGDVVETEASAWKAQAGLDVRGFKHRVEAGGFGIRTNAMAKAGNRGRTKRV